MKWIQEKLPERFCQFYSSCKRLKFKAKVSLWVVLFSCCCVQSGYKARFICDVMLRNYTTHNPKVWPWCLWLVELPVNVPQHLQDIHSDPVQLWLWRVTARLRATESLFCLWLPWEPAPPLKDWNSDAVSTKMSKKQFYPLWTEIYTNVEFYFVIPSTRVTRIQKFILNKSQKI